MINLIISLQYSIKLHENSDFCFTQKTKIDSSLSVTFYAVEGGKMVVSANFTHNNVVLDNKTDIASGSFFANKTADGEYMICFANTENDKKQITFFIQYIELTPEKKESDEISDQLINIQKKMSEVHQHQRQSQQIERRLQTVMVQIQGSVKFWTFLKFAVIVTCAIYQIFTFKKFFAKKKTAV